MRIRVTEGCMSWGVDIDKKDFLFSCPLRKCADAYEALIDKYVETDNKEQLIHLLSRIADLLSDGQAHDCEKTINGNGLKGYSVFCEFNNMQFEFFWDDEEYELYAFIDGEDASEKSSEFIAEIIKGHVEVYLYDIGEEDYKKEEDFKYYLQSPFFDAAKDFGELTDTYGPCECCGDYVYEYQFDV